MLRPAGVYALNVIDVPPLEEVHGHDAVVAEAFAHVAVGGAAGRAARPRARERRAARLGGAAAASPRCGAPRPPPCRASRCQASPDSVSQITARQKQLALAAAIMGSFVAGLDATVVNVALPAIRDDLGGGLAGQQWVSNAYLLTLGSLILVGGSLGDLFGERRVFSIGVGGLRRRVDAVRARADDRGADRRPRAAGRRSARC